MPLTHTIRFLFPIAALLFLSQRPALYAAAGGSTSLSQPKRQLSANEIAFKEQIERQNTRAAYAEYDAIAGAQLTAHNSGKLDACGKAKNAANIQCKAQYIREIIAHEIDPRKRLHVHLEGIDPSIQSILRDTPVTVLESSLQKNPYADLASRNVGILLKLLEFLESTANHLKGSEEAYVRELRQEAKTNKSKKRELKRYDELTRKEWDVSTGLKSSQLDTIRMTPGNYIRAVNKQGHKKNKAPIYQRAYYLAFDELYRLWIAEQQHSGNSCSEQLTRTALGHVRETDAAWEPGTILGGMLRFFSLTP